MSALVIGLVYKHFPGKGAVFTVALALADHAHEDGTHVFPSVDGLVDKTRLNRRTVQRALRSLEDMGWLELVKAASGRPGYANVYRINPYWLETGLMPVRDVVPDNSSEPNAAPVDKERGGMVSPVNSELPTARGAALSTQGAALSTRGAASDRPNRHITVINHGVGDLYTAREISNWQPSEQVLAQAALIDSEIELTAAEIEFRAYWQTRDTQLPLAHWDLKFLQRVQLLAVRRAEHWGGAGAEYLLPPSEPL